MHQTDLSPTRSRLDWMPHARLHRLAAHAAARPPGQCVSRAVPGAIAWRWAGCVAAFALMTGTAMAAGADAPKNAATRYQQERAACLGGQTQQDRTTCLREAGAALQEARQGRPEANRAYEANALRRCEGLPGTDRADCIARLRGQGSVKGSVAAGGLYRELVTREPAAAGSATASASASAPAPVAADTTPAAAPTPPVKP